MLRNPLVPPNIVLPKGLERILVGQGKGFRLVLRKIPDFMLNSSEPDLKKCLDLLLHSLPSLKFKICFKKLLLKVILVERCCALFKINFYTMYFDQILPPPQLSLDSFYVLTHPTSCSVLDTSFENIFTGQFHALLELNNMLLLFHFCCSSILSYFISD